MSSNGTPLQPTISNYFQPTSIPRKTGRRMSSPIDLTVEDGELELPSKRLRLTGPDEPPPLNRAGASSSSSVNDWRYSPDRPKSLHKRPSDLRTKSDEKRLAAFKRSLLQDNNRFIKKDHPGEVGPDQEISLVNEAKHVVDGAGQYSDTFKQLTDMFSNPRKQKGIVKTSAKKVMELGPSGEPYTPLEKQVSDHWILCNTLFVTSLCDLQDTSTQERTRWDCSDGRSWLQIQIL